MLGLTVVVLLPIYYLAKSKGYNVAVMLIASAVLGVGLPIVMQIYNDEDLLPVIDITFPFLALFIVWLLPPKEGAPGEKYLKITFTCPECNEEVTFGRSHEGNAELCPKCGEIIKIPLDGFSPPMLSKNRDKSNVASGPVCFATFGNEMLALQMHALLADHGIDSEIIEGTGGGMLPQLSGTQGFKLTIDAKDWEEAVEVEGLIEKKDKPVHCSVLVSPEEPEPGSEPGSVLEN